MWDKPRPRLIHFCAPGHLRRAASYNPNIVASMSTGVTSLLERLDLERLDRDLFRGFSPDDGRPQVFGGQVAAQALVAAVRTVAPDPERPRVAHSLHAYFLRPGNPKIPIVYDVDRIRDGRSFATRRVVAIQDGEAIFNLSTSFQVDQDGPTHQIEMPEVPPPEQVPSNDERIAKAIEQDRHPLFQFLQQLERPIDLRDTDPMDPSAPTRKPGPHHVWFKTRSDMPEDPLLHQCVLTYASDFYLVEGGLREHGLTWMDPTLKVASLDHALWFHRPFRADEWLLYTVESPSTSGARGLNIGHVFSRDGVLVATAVQEGLMRRRG